MKRLDLTDEEFDELLQVMRTHAAHLCLEIARTDHAVYKTILRDRDRQVSSLLAKLEALAPPAEAPAQEKRSAA